MNPLFRGSLKARKIVVLPDARWGQMKLLRGVK